MIAKLLTIIKSRFKQQREEAWIKERRATCLECEYNSLNTTSTSLAHNFLATLSYFFSWITFRAKDEGSYGQCTACGCDCFFKSLDIENNCPKNKWKK
jgi:hypothetical protein